MVLDINDAAQRLIDKDIAINNKRLHLSDAQADKSLKKLIDAFPAITTAALSGFQSLRRGPKGSNSLLELCPFTRRPKLHFLEPAHYLL